MSKWGVLPSEMRIQEERQEVLSGGSFFGKPLC